MARLHLLHGAVAVEEGLALSQTPPEIGQVPKGELGQVHEVSFTLLREAFEHDAIRFDTLDAARRDLERPDAEEKLRDPNMLRGHDLVVDGPHAFVPQDPGGEDVIVGVSPFVEDMSLCPGTKAVDGIAGRLHVVHVLRIGGPQANHGIDGGLGQVHLLSPGLLHDPQGLRQASSWDPPGGREAVGDVVPGYHAIVQEEFHGHPMVPAWAIVREDGQIALLAYNHGDKGEVGQNTRLGGDDAVQRAEDAEAVGRDGQGIPAAPPHIDLQGILALCSPFMGREDQGRRPRRLHIGLPDGQGERGLEGAILLAFQTCLLQVAAGADGLPPRVLKTAGLLQGIQVVHLHIVVEDSPAERTPVALFDQDGLAHIRGAAAALGPQKLIQDLVRQRRQPLGVPGDLAREPRQPRGDLLLVVYRLLDDAEPLAAIHGHGAVVLEGDDLGALVQGHLGAAAAFQEFSACGLEVAHKIMPRLHGTI